jgi:hypothetical protein
MNRRHLLLIVFSALQLYCAGQRNILKQLIHADTGFRSAYAEVLENPHKYHLQVIYTQIIRDSNNKPHLHKYLLNPKTQNYFYPASLVKLPLVALALEKLDSLNIPGLNRETRLKIDSAWYCQKREYHDSSAKNDNPTIAHFIKKMLLVSDNYSYNRIYEFLTPARINRRLHQMGYTHAMVNQRFTASCDSNENRYTNPFTFFNDSGRVIYKQGLDSNMGNINNDAKNTLFSKGFFDGSKVLPPKDFRRNNYIPFDNMNDIMLSLIFPLSYDSTKRFHLTPDDYDFLHKYMSMLPRESDYPHYSQKDYKDNFKKYIYFGDKADSIITDTTVRSFNIVGRAYGFLADCAYIADVQDSVEFGLSVLIYANEKNILNTDNYQYDDIALPFMHDLGQLIYKYEKKRRKKHKPDLSAFKFRYP